MQKTLTEVVEYLERLEVLETSPVIVKMSLANPKSSVTWKSHPIKGASGNPKTMTPRDSMP